MFDLEQSIAKWRHSFQQRGSIVAERMEELESHLREAVIDLGRHGLDEEESFLIASKRLGHPAVLGAEYAKNSLLGASRDRLVWMLSGYLGISLCGIFISALVASVSTGLAFVGAGAAITVISAMLIQLVFWLGILVLLLRVDQAPLVWGRFLQSSLLAMLALMFISMLAHPFAVIAQTRLVNPTWFGEVSRWMNIGQFGIQLLIYVFCFVALYKARQSKVLRVAE